MNVSTLSSAQGLPPLDVLQAGVPPQAQASASAVWTGSAGTGAALASGGLQDAEDAGYTGLQTAASYVQSASGYIGQVRDILSQMADLTSPGPGTQAGASAFSDLQEQLRQIVGGTPSAIGGQGAAVAGAEFDGSAIFGSSSSSQLTVGSGSAAVPPLSVPVPGLRQGAILSLIGQDSSGAFLRNATDSGIAETISAASGQAVSAAAQMDASQTDINSAVSSLDAGALGAPLPAFSEAWAATRAAIGSVFGQAASALGSYSGLGAGSAVSLLKSD